MLVVDRDFEIPGTTHMPNTTKIIQNDAEGIDVSHE
jgi:hypothetical protein